MLCEEGGMYACYERQEACMHATKGRRHVSMLRKAGGMYACYVRKEACMHAMCCVLFEEVSGPACQAPRYKPHTVLLDHCNCVLDTAQMYACMRVRMCACMHACTSTRMHVCLFSNAQLLLDAGCLCMCVRACVCAHTYIHQCCMCPRSA
jgi:hypothetical protein